MPKIIDYAYNYTTSTTGTTIACDVPDTATNDVLLACVTADTGTQTFTCTGWTALPTTPGFSNTTRSYFMWRLSTGASEPLSYTWTASAAETYNIIILSIRDVDTTTPFLTPVGTNRASHNTAFPSVTTTRNNSLILYHGSHPSTAVIPSSIEANVTQLFSMDGSAHSDSIGWNIKSTAGSTGTTVPSSVSGTTYGGSLVTIAVQPPASGATLIPAYCTEDLSLYLDPIHGTTAFRGNTAYAGTGATYYTGTIGGKTNANATVTARTDTGLNSYRSTGGQSSSTGRTWQSAVLQFSAAKTTMAGKNILLHVQPYLPADIQTLEGIGLSRGVAIGLHSTAGNYKVWHVHGANTPWGTRMVPVVVNTSNTSGVVQTTGTINTASIGGIGTLVSGFVASADMIWTMAWQLDKTTVCGGNATEPVDIPGIVRACSNGHERMSMLQQGQNQMLVLQPFQVGNGGTDPTRLDISTAAIEFPQQYNIASGQTFYCSADNVAGVTFYPGSSDYFNISSSVWSSSSKFHWGFHASSSASATVVTSGAQVIGAGTVSLSSNIPVSGMTFDSCSQITAVGTTITNCIINNSTATASEGAISITGASQATLQAELNKITLCTFSGNTVPAGALRIIYTGTAGAISLSMSSNTFSGNTADIRWEAPAASNLTLNLSGSAAASTYSATNSNTVTFVNTKALSITGMVSGSDVVITTSDTNNVIVDIDQNSGSTYVYSYNYSAGTYVDIKVMKAGYVPYMVYDYLLGSQDASLPIAQVADRNYLP